jgi:hypothetical protein
MGHRTKDQKANGTCGSGLHAWVDGQGQCPQCRKARSKVYDAVNYDKRETARKARHAALAGIEVVVRYLKEN